MTKYTHEQRLQVLGVCKDCADGKLPLSLAEKRVRSLVPSYPAKNIGGEISRFKKYRSGQGAYGYAYPATWAKALRCESSRNFIMHMMAEGIGPWKDY